MGDTLMTILDPLDIFNVRSDKKLEEERARTDEANQRERDALIANQDEKGGAARQSFRSGSVFTNSLGEPVTAAQTDGTRLI